MLKPEAMSRYCLRQSEFRSVGMACEGLLNKQIADKQSLSIKTIEAHLTGASNKLGTHSSRAMLAKLYREQLVELP